MPTSPIEAWYRSGVLAMGNGQSIVVAAWAGKNFVATGAAVRVVTAKTGGTFTISLGTNASDYDNLMWDKTLSFPDGPGMYELLLGTQSYTSIVADNGNRWPVIDVGTNPIRLNISGSPSGGTYEAMIRGFYL